VLIDASALISLLGGEPAAQEVQALLNQGRARMTTVNLAESVDRLERRYGLAAARTRPVIDGLLDDALTLLPLGPFEAWRSGELRARHYHRTRRPVSLADAVLVASAAAGCSVASADRHLLAMAASERLGVVALPDSRGRRPRI
jgi:predicted nucleic acid-binding protein